MDKLWVKLLKAYEHDDVKLEKDQVIELDEKIAKGLIDLGLAEKAEAPSADDINKKIKEEMVTTITDAVTKQLQGIMGEVGDKLEKSIPEFAKARDHDKESLFGFG